MPRKSRALPPSPIRRFNSTPEVIRLVVLMYVRFPLSLRNVEIRHIERGVDVCHETVRFSRTRDMKAALTFMNAALKRHGSLETITTNGLCSCKAAMNELG